MAPMAVNAIARRNTSELIAHPSFSAASSLSESSTETANSKIPKYAYPKILATQGSKPFDAQLLGERLMREYGGFAHTFDTALGMARVQCPYMARWL
ncbi:hypothetical protein B0H15DRAFT_944817 [Mycena belliarum]|uniref:Uncharacterized protein n=1 Tax=Mycena belliarum TaxID=1033014 RepID=A0AAD6UHW2_9AGAR|nr:hypothetical protein B0H15DRAFT_944817 [Mycena belliae]